MTEELGWTNLADRRTELRLALFYKLLHDEVNIDTTDILTKSDERTWREKGKPTTDTLVHK